MSEKDFIQYDSIDVARHIMAECQERGVGDIGNTKINKLLYIVYGTFLALHKRPIINERPKYFPYGPVFPRVFKAFDRLTPIKFELCEDLKKVVTTVIETFKDFSAGKLSAWSHAEGSPWDEVKNKFGERYGVELDDNKIYNYFKNSVIKYV
jgi:uncharacterized phage-associated protein